jgi:glycine/D-amino acid oxidase-like deaminating enzyme
LHRSSRSSIDIKEWFERDPQDKRNQMANTHAIVIGGSMAGLCAARVLSNHYDKVTVIDRDAYPAGAHERPGVPQSRHVHALLMRGRLELERLFPGFEQTMLQCGALDINFGRDFAALRPGGWPSGGRTRLLRCSRAAY